MACLMEFFMKYRIKNVKDLRRRYRKLLSETRAPILICSNHLTMADSAVIAWLLGAVGGTCSDTPACPGTFLSIIIFLSSNLSDWEPG